MAAGRLIRQIDWNTVARDWTPPTRDGIFRYKIKCVGAKGWTQWMAGPQGDRTPRSGGVGP